MSLFPVSFPHPSVPGLAGVAANAPTRSGFDARAAPRGPRAGCARRPRGEPEVARASLDARPYRHRVGPFASVTRAYLRDAHGSFFTKRDDGASARPNATLASPFPVTRR